MEVGEINLAQQEDKNQFSIEIKGWKNTNEFGNIVNLTIEFQGLVHLIKDSLFCIFNDYEQALLFRLTLIL